MAQANRRSGLNPLAYMGVEPVSPNNFVIDNRAPTVNDYFNFNVGDEWLHESTEDVYKLVDKTAQVATWVLMTGASGVALQFDTDSGFAVPSAGVINVLGGTNINTSGAGNTITVNLDASLTGLTSVSTTDLTVTNAPTFSALGLGVVQSSATGVLSSSNGTDGQILIASTGLAPAWNTLTAGTGISIAETPNTITITATSAGDVQSLTGNSGGPISPTANNINLVTANTTVTFVGAGSTITQDFGLSNLILGSLPTFTTGVRNVGLGLSNLVLATSGSDNVTAGYHAGNALTTGSSNIIIGSSAGTAFTTESGNILISSSSVSAAGHVGESDVIRIVSTSAAGDNNIFIGQDAGNITYTVGVAIGNTALGANALAGLTTGAGNSAWGVNALTACTTGSSNTAFGNATLPACTTGGSNVAIGRFSTGSLTTGSQNIVLGVSAATLLVTGSNNTILGNDSGSAYTSSESSNVLIKNTGVVGESNVIRIGQQGSSDGQQDKCWIAGIRGVTTVNADAVAVLIDSVGQLGTVSSSRKVKENIKPIEESILGLNPVSFTYKDHANPKTTYGLIAEEVADIMPNLVIYDQNGDPETVKYHELPALLLAEIKRLARRVEDLESQSRQ